MQCYATKMWSRDISVIWQEYNAGSQATLTSKKAPSHHTGSELADDEQSLGDDDEIIKDCNGRLVPRLIIRMPTGEEVSLRPYCNSLPEV